MVVTRLLNGMPPIVMTKSEFKKKKIWNELNSEGSFVVNFWETCSIHVPNVVRYPLVMTNSSLLKMAIEIVDLPIKNGDFP